MIELDKGYIGNVCEIANIANELLCTGKLDELPDPDNEFMLSIVSRADNFPVLAHHTTLKVHIRNAKQGSIFLVGKVDVSKTGLIQLRDVQILAKSEKREAFRVKFEKNVAFREKRVPRSAGVIRLQDISTTGFMCRSKTELSTRSIYSVELPIDDGAYLFDFQVVRNLPSSTDGIYVYGCQFVSVDEKRQDTLAKFVFSLQRESISKLQE